MAIITLRGSPAQVLKEIIVAENPQLAEFPVTQFLLGTPLVQHGTRTMLNIVGNAGDVNTVSLSGNVEIFYNRIDLEKLIAGQHPLPINGVTSTHDVLATIGDIWGIVIDPQLVLSEPVQKDAPVVTLKFLDNKYLFIQDAVSIPVSWNNHIDISSLWRSTELEGLALPWPYPINIRSIWSVTELSGLEMPTLLYDMQKLSAEYTILPGTWGHRYCNFKKAGDDYAPQYLKDLMLLATNNTIPWETKNNEMLPWNLWGAEFVYNGPATDGIHDHELRIRPNSTYFHEGVGDISIFYTKEVS